MGVAAHPVVRAPKPRGKAPAGSEWVLSVGSARHKALSYTVQTVYFWSNGRLR